MDVAPEQLAEMRGRIEIFEPPKRGNDYFGGFDGALGIEGRDFDAGQIIYVQGDRFVQAAEAHGHWGERFDRVICPLGRYYNDAFICGETQGGGLATLRRMYDSRAGGWHYFNLFKQRREEADNRAVTDRLGYTRTRFDVTLSNLQALLNDGRLILRSAALIDQMAKLQWRTRKGRDAEEAMDGDLIPKLSGGGSPDLVIALAMAVHAACEWPRSEERTAKYPQGTIGHLVRHRLDEPDVDLDDDEDFGFIPTRRT